MKRSDFFTMRPVSRRFTRDFGSPALPRYASTWDVRGTTSAVIFSTRRCYARASFMSMPETKEFFSANVNSRSLLRIILSLTQHFMCDRSGIAFAECYVLQEVGKRVSFTPTEIDVREFPGLIPKVK